MLILREIDFWARNIMRTKWRHFLMKMGTHHMHHKDQSIINVFMSNNSLKANETKPDKTEMRNGRILIHNWR